MGLPQDLVSLVYTSTVVGGQVSEGFLSTVTTLQRAWAFPALSTGRPAPQEPSALPWSWADQHDWSPVCGFLKVCRSRCDSCRSCEGGVTGAAVPGLQVAATEAGTAESPRQGSWWEGVLGMKQSRCGEWAVLSAGDRPGIRTQWVS